MLNRSWHDSVWLFEQMALASSGDSLLLVEDAVLALHSPITLGSLLAKCSSISINVYALKGDCELRGIDNKYPAISTVDYAGYVELVVAHDKQVTW